MLLAYMETVASRPELRPIVFRDPALVCSVVINRSLARLLMEFSRSGQILTANRQPPTAGADCREPLPPTEIFGCWRSCASRRRPVTGRASSSVGESCHPQDPIIFWLNAVTFTSRIPRRWYGPSSRETLSSGNSRMGSRRSDRGVWNRLADSGYRRSWHREVDGSRCLVPRCPRPGGCRALFWIGPGRSTMVSCQSTRIWH